MAHRRYHGRMVALTAVSVELYQHNLILQIIELNSQTVSVVLRVMERFWRIL